MESIDTSVLVRMVVRDNLHQANVAEIFIQRGVWVSVLVIAETAWVLRKIYNRTPVQIADIIAMILQHGKLIVQDEDTIEEALQLFRSKPALGFSDCLILHTARKAGHLPLGTFDRTLGKCEGVRNLTVAS